MIRPIREVLRAQGTVEGGGVQLDRAFGHEQLPKFDPFLMLDHFHSCNPEEYREGFPLHPHRGFETITYMLTGQMEHRDVLGNHGVVLAGGVQWMTAGSGIIHEEQPAGDAQGCISGLQLWANLPAAQKMTPPRYQGFDPEEIPTVTVNGARVRIIAGALDQIRGPVKEVAIQPEYLDVAMAPNSAFTHAVPRGHTVFALVLEGQASFAGGEMVGADEVVLFDDGDDVAVTTGDDTARFILVSGKPLHEPVAWRGPVVMNREDELQDAFREFKEGTFVK